MNKQTIITGYFLALAGATFWISWFLMPDPGTTDARHILEIVKQTRTSVLYSVIVQIISSVLYSASLLSLSQLFLPQRKVTFIGITLFGIGAMGMCSDAFFHLLAYYMTDDAVSLEENLVTVMNFMQTGGVIFLIPLLLPFFIGSLLLAIGLSNQQVISKIPGLIFSAALLLGPIGAFIVSKIFLYNGNVLSLTVLGLFAAGHVFMGFELITSFQKEKITRRAFQENLF